MDGHDIRAEVMKYAQANGHAAVPIHSLDDSSMPVILTIGDKQLWLECGVKENTRFDVPCGTKAVLFCDNVGLCCISENKKVRISDMHYIDILFMWFELL